VILGIPAFEIAAARQTLTLESTRGVGKLFPGKSWESATDVRAVYAARGSALCNPRFVVCDGAVELRETSTCWERPAPEWSFFRDFQHSPGETGSRTAGHQMKSPSKSFCSAMGTTRCQSNSRKFAHLTPPS